MHYSGNSVAFTTKQSELRSVGETAKTLGKEAPQDLGFQCIEREKCKLMEIQNNPEYNDGIREDIRNRIKGLNRSPKGQTHQPDYRDQRENHQGTRQRCIIGEKDMNAVYRTRCTISSVLMAIGMAMDVLVKALLSGGVVAGAAGKGYGDAENVKEWLRNKLKALALG